MKWTTHHWTAVSPSCHPTLRTPKEHFIPVGLAAGYLR